MNDFQEEQQRFEREKQRVKDTAVPPWVGYNEEEKMKAQILELSAVSPSHSFTIIILCHGVNLVVHYCRIALICCCLLGFRTAGMC